LDQPARKHGGYAEVIGPRLDAKVAEVSEALAADAPLRDSGGGLPRADSALVVLLAKALVRLEDVGRWLDDYGKRDQATGAERTSLLDLERRLRVEAADYLDAMAMSPRSRARLGLDLVKGFDLAAALAELPYDPQPEEEPDAR
jgi:hypothetical protein